MNYWFLKTKNIAFFVKYGNISELHFGSILQPEPLHVFHQRIIPLQRVASLMELPDLVLTCCCASLAYVFEAEDSGKLIFAFFTPQMDHFRVYIK